MRGPVSLFPPVVGDGHGGPAVILWRVTASKFKVFFLERFILGQTYINVGGFA